jgi:hypothetical protein
VVFNYDPHCPPKFYTDYLPAGAHQRQTIRSPASPRTSRASASGRTFDCDGCTGLDGKETQVHWQVGGLLPPKPTLRVGRGRHGRHAALGQPAGDHAPAAGGWNPGYRFGGYRVYRADDWRRRVAAAVAGALAADRAVPAARACVRGSAARSLVDPSVPSDTVAYGMPHYPPGRYRFVEHALLDGFDYLYVVTTVFTKLTFVNGAPVLAELESPLTTSFDEHVTPQVAAAVTTRGVWVVPNPYRANAAWERSPVAGDVFTRHIDFFGLPRARCSVRIYTLAGATWCRSLDHDGSSGDGQAPWNLISRNGQDVESASTCSAVESPPATRSAGSW